MTDTSLAYEALASGRMSSNGYVRAQCPYCPSVYGSPDRKASFAIKVRTGGFYCMRCGTKGRLNNVPENVIATATAAPANNGEIPVIDRPENFVFLGRGDGLIAKSFRGPRNYLARRGVRKKTLDEADIGYCTGGYFGGRIIVPIHHPLLPGKWAGFVSRDWTGRAELAYRYPQGMARGSILFNEAALYRERETPALLVEGVFDALPYWPRAVAFLGKPGGGHYDLLLDACRPLVVVLDGDAHREGWALAQRLKLDGKRAGSVHLPPKQDPNSVDPRWLIEEATNAIN